ncbi:uncharacterized protein LOC127861963 isoform X2 [Dreissena polymorpha]|uniref:uncharacterized protein LOC127861963 isoform X2 n=1 Tax=Dreissena polymorpha TaxID=45954 RepID=UPI0022649927|nr:uncharacterized protein LOC127861963 isoform X2 [Dreissena polymorpha]
MHVRCEPKFNFSAESFIRHKDTILFYGSFQLTGLATAIVCHTVLAILAICTFTIGVLQYGQCPYEPELPLFLVLHGTAVLVKTCLRVASSFHRRHAEDNERNTLDTINDVISVFVVLWTLTGSVWTFGILNLVDISNLEVSRYCDMLVFMTAFILLVFLYALFLAAVTGVIALIIYYKIQTRDNKSPLPYISHTTR